MGFVRLKNELIIPFLQVFGDLICIEGSFLFSYWLRLYSPLTKIVPVTLGLPPLQIYFYSSLVVIMIWLVIFYMMGAYKTRRNVTKIDEINLIIKGVTFGMLIVTSAAFYYRGFSYSRPIFIFIWIFSILSMSISKILIMNYEYYLHRKKKGIFKAAVVGSSRWRNDIYETIQQNPGLGLDVVGYIGENPFLLKKSPYLGSFDHIHDIVKKNHIDVLYLALSEEEGPKLIFLLTACIGLNIEFYLVPNFLEMITSRFRVESLGGIPVLKIKDVAITGWNAVFKRIFDLFVSFVILALFWPAFFLVALVIKLDSQGTVFYRQRRVGIDGYEYTLIKFRTMYMEAEKETGPVWAKKDDTRVTRIGRILRRTSIDELPQLLNVLKGEMSLVGPRPERPHFVKKFRNQIPKYLERHRVKSGMTGWAQVNGLRGEVPIEKRTQYDIYYVENWSFLFDIKILMMTIWAIVKGENSY